MCDLIPTVYPWREAYQLGGVLRPDLHDGSKHQGLSNTQYNPVIQPACLYIEVETIRILSQAQPLTKLLPMYIPTHAIIHTHNVINSCTWVCTCMCTGKSIDEPRLINVSDCSQTAEAYAYVCTMPVSLAIRWELELQE